MYLSKIQIPWSQVVNPYQLHRALWTLFPGQHESARDFLFRVEQQIPGGGAQILMQSQRQPQPHTEAVRVLGCKSLDLVFQPGQRLRFRLRANPVKSIKDAAKGIVVRNGQEYARTARVPLIQEPQQREWLARKLAGSVVLESLLVTRELPLYFHKGKGGHRGKIQPVLFDGLLQVQEGDRLFQLIERGVGPAKSFGCGLISLAAG